MNARKYALSPWFSSLCCVAGGHAYGCGDGVQLGVGESVAVAVVAELAGQGALADAFAVDGNGLKRWKTAIDVKDVESFIGMVEDVGAQTWVSSCPRRVPAKRCHEPRTSGARCPRQSSLDHRATELASCWHDLSYYGNSSPSR